MIKRKQLTKIIFASFMMIFIFNQLKVTAQTNDYISYISTNSNVNFNLDQGFYRVSLRIFVEQNTTIKNFSTQITEPWTNIEWDISRVKKNAWIQLNRRVQLRSPAQNASFRIQLNNDPKLGGGIGTFFIDDIIIEKINNSGKTFNKKVLSNYEIYPNPTANFININLEHNATYALYSVTGTLVSESKKPFSNFKIQTSGLTPGVYLLKISSIKGIIIKKIVVE